MDEIGSVLAEYDRAFGGILVEGIDLAAANRLSLYILLQTRTGCASPSRAARCLGALNDLAVLARDRLRKTSPPPALPSPGPPRVLLFLEGANPSVDGTLRATLDQFSPDEARVAVAYPETLPSARGYDALAMQDLVPRGVARNLVDLERSLRERQRDARVPILRRASLRIWMLRMSLRTAGAARAFRCLYDCFPSTVLVTASDTGFWGRCATLEASHRGIASVTLQHGMMVGEAGYVPVVSDRFAAWGEASARWLRQRGVPAVKIIVVGAPRLQDPASTPRKDRAVLAAGLAIDPSRRWVLLATNPIRFSKNAAMLEVARAGVRAWDVNALLVLKLHPSEEEAAYRAIIGSDPGVVLVTHGAAPLYDLLGAVDAVLTFHSSVGLEGMLFDRPIVSLEPFGEENPLSYGREGAAAVARTADDLARALSEDVAPGPSAGARRAARERYLKDNLHAVGEKSAAQVRALIQGLAKERTP